MSTSFFKRSNQITILFTLFIFLSINSFSYSQTSVFINEIHYDNIGGDTGETVEVAGPAGTNLTGWKIVLYNGNGGGSYGTIALSGAIPNQCDGFGALAFSKTGIQNGAPDGLALVDNNDNTIQFLSYEGTFTAAGGPANGLTSTDIGVSESSTTTPVGNSLQLGGTGLFYEDFTWNTESPNTFGACNSGQSFVLPVCAITKLETGNQSVCEPLTNTYSQEIIVSFINSPATGTLDVNGQSFAIGASPQTVLLAGLPADGNPVDVTVTFSAEPGCTHTANALFTAPQDCSPPSSNINETIENVLTKVEVLLEDQNTPGNVTKKLKRVKNKLEKALEKLTDGKVDKAFEEIIKAVVTLVSIERKGVDVTECIKDLVDATRQLTQEAIVEAQNFVGEPDVDKELAKAEKQMVEAQKDLDSNRPHKAIKHFKKAYKYAQKAIVHGGGLPKNILAEELVKTEQILVPTDIVLTQNYPNPFNPSTTITFFVPEAEEVSLAIYNLRGQLVQTLVSGAIAAGWHRLVWDGTDSHGFRVASGIYVYRLETKDFVATRKLVFTK